MIAAKDRSRACSVEGLRLKASGSKWVNMHMNAVWRVVIMVAPLALCCVNISASCDPPPILPLPPITAATPAWPLVPSHPPKRLAATRKRHLRTVRYRITVLGATLDSDDSVVVNNSGDLLVENEAWRNGRKETLQNTFKDKEYRATETVGMNDQGVVAGNVTGEEDGAYLLEFSRAVVWRRGKMTPLPLMRNMETVASGINNKGEIAGYGFEQTNDALANTDRAFLFRKGKITEIGRGMAVCLNDHSQVLVQWSDPSAFRLYAKDKGQMVGTPVSDTYLWDKGARRPIAVPQGYGNFETFAGINNRGEFAGQISTGHLSRYFGSTINRAFVWRHGKTRVLGTLGGEASQALGINNSGQVVGKADVGPPDAHRNENTHAFLWQNGHMHDLNGFVSARSGWVLYSANGLNDKGCIVGTGSKGTFLLKPIRAKRP